MPNHPVAHHYLACDLGAESGRLIAGRLQDGLLGIEEIHRFPNGARREGGSLLWDIPALRRELQTGLRLAAASGREFASISTDSWGVDYILFSPSGEIMEPVYHYRDGRTGHGVRQALARVSREEIFAETGIQFMPINTLFQLAAEPPGRLRQAGCLLGVGDAFNFFLSGVPKIEVSMASTFQLYNPRARRWSSRLIETLDFPASLFPEIVPAGTRLGSMRPELRAESGLPAIEVIATCSHDTGAAVAGVPALDGEGSWAYLSSGTWSLMGVERAEPVLNPLACELNFTNEIGFGGTVRLLKNISGLWLLQECRRLWREAGLESDYAALAHQAALAPPFRSLIQPALPEFLAPENMLAQIAASCRETGQPAPETQGQYVRCILESLALLYRRTLGQLERLTGQKIECLRVVGGGSQNLLLNEFTANALQIPVHAGPAEATAAGNVMIQAIALGHVASLGQARRIIRDSSPMRNFLPRATADWEKASARFSRLPG